MPRAIYIGGFANGQTSADKVCDALGNYYDDVEAFTFAEAYRQELGINRRAKEAEIITHSAGILTVRDANPDRIRMFNAPYRRSRVALALLSVAKTTQMVGCMRSGDDLTAVLDYGRDVLQEVRHDFMGNMRPYFNGEISYFDSIGYAFRRKQEGIPVSMACADRDLYFPPTEAILAKAAFAGISSVPLSGVHDELVLNPQKVLEEYFSKVDS